MSVQSPDGELSRWEELTCWSSRPARQRWLHSYVLFPEYAELLGRFPHATVLDYGCGDGSLSAFLHARFSASRIVAYDEAGHMRSLARTQLANIPVPDELPDARFDVICANMVLQDVEQPAKLLEALHALLAPSGAAIFSVPHPVYSLIEAHHLTTRRERMSPGPTSDIMRYPYEEVERVYWSSDDGMWTFLHNRTMQTYTELFFRAGLTVLLAREPYARPQGRCEPDLYDIYSRVPAAMLFVCGSR